MTLQNTNNKTKAKAPPQRRTQFERRAVTRGAILDSAKELFGKNGFEKTSLEHIAKNCNITTGPIYHYFSNKKDLFESVVKSLELDYYETLLEFEKKKNVENIDVWNSFLEKCFDEEFRQIVLIDSLNILGRERWADSNITQKSFQLFFADTKKGEDEKAVLKTRLLVAALTELAIYVAESSDPTSLKEISREVFIELTTIR
ncbi:MAG: TetR/AcrR family transcriptional regulator [Parvibaculales bacterium]